MSRPSPIHARLKPILVGLIKGFEAEQAADMILRLVLDPDVTGAAPPPPPPTQSGATRQKPGPRPGTMRAPPVLTEPIDPEKEYTIIFAADALGLEEGTVRSKMVKESEFLKPIRGVHDDGRAFVRIKGSEIIRAREERQALVGTKRG